MTSERRPRAVTEALRFRAQLLREEAPVLREMVRAMRRLVDDLEGQMIAVGERLAMQASLGRVSPGAVVEFGEYVALRRAAEAALLRYSGGVERQVAALQRLRIQQAIDHTRRLTASALPPGLTFDVLAGLGVQWATLDTAAFESMVGRMRDGSSVRRYLDARVVTGTQQRMADVLTDGIVRNPRETARLLRGTFTGGAVQAVRVARTETLRVYRDVQRESYQRNSNVVRGYRRQASLDDRTCFACWVLDGTLYANEGDMEEHVLGRCFPAGTLASGPAPVAATTRYYRGDLVTIRTASGVDLSFTPNHPILTRRGWVEGGLLVEGDDVFRSADREGAAALIDKDDHQMPARIEEVAASCGMVAAEMPTAAEDFHGDGVGSDVHIVRSNRLLGSDNQAAFLNPLGEHDLGRGAVGRPLLSRLGAAYLLGHRHDAASGRLLRDSDAAVMLGERSLIGEQPVSLGLAATIDSRLAQSDLDGRTRHAKCAGEHSLGLPGRVSHRDLIEGQGECRDLRRPHLPGRECVASSLIAPEPARHEDRPEGGNARVPAGGDHFRGLASGVVLDRVVNVSRRRFAGHVYNLQTQGEWYFANGIVVHNCFTVPETVTWAELGIRGMDEVEPQESGRQRFERLPDAQQRRIVGNDRQYEAWKSGTIGLADMVARHTHPTFGSQLVQASARQSLAGGGLTRLPGAEERLSTGAALLRPAV